MWGFFYGDKDRSTNATLDAVLKFVCMSIKLIYGIVGWYGVLAILLAYTLNSFGLVGIDNLFYQLLNFTGAIGIILVAWRKKDTQPAILNVVWAIVALVAIVRILL